MDKSELNRALKRFRGTKRKEMHKTNQVYSEQHIKTTEKQFNTRDFPFVESKMEYYNSHCVSMMYSNEYLRRVLANPPDFVSYEQSFETMDGKSNHSTFGSLFRFIQCAEWCKTRLQEVLLEHGWSANITGVDPIASSHNIPELLTNTQHCILGAIYIRLSLNIHVSG